MRIKGRAVHSTVEFILSKFSPGKYHEFLEAYPDFKKYEDLHEIGWYPIEDYISYLEAIDKFFGFGDMSLLEKIGEYSAERAFDTSHKLFKNMTPDILFSNAQIIAATYYSGGIAQTKFLKEKKVQIEFTDYPPSEALSRRILGWLKKGLAISGGKNIHSQILKTENGLAYMFEWD